MKINTQRLPENNFIIDQLSHFKKYYDSFKSPQKTNEILFEYLFKEINLKNYLENLFQAEEIPHERLSNKTNSKKRKTKSTSVRKARITEIKCKVNM